MSLAWRNPIHTLPFAEPVADTLDREFAEQPLGRRLQALRKVAVREAHRSERLAVGHRFLAARARRAAAAAP